MNYELATVLPEGSTPAKKKAARELIEKHIKILKGTVQNVDDWGEKELAYNIGKNSKGSFLIFDLDMGKSSAKALNEKLKLENAIIRYLLISKN